MSTVLILIRVLRLYRYVHVLYVQAAELWLNFGIELEALQNYSYVQATKLLRKAYEGVLADPVLQDKFCYRYAISNSAIPPMPNEQFKELEGDNRAVFSLHPIRTQQYFKTRSFMRQQDDCAANEPHA